MIEKIKEYAIKNDIPIFEDDSKDFICQYILNHGVNKILEIGSAIGYSAICMASVRDDVKVWTIERDFERYSMALKNIENNNLKERIIIYNDDALTFKNELLDNDFQLLFIDAAKAQYQKFFEKYTHNLLDTGTIIIDNVDFHGFVNGSRQTTNRNTRQLVGKIRRFLDYLKENDEYESTYYPIGDGIIVCKRNDESEK